MPAVAPRGYGLFLCGTESTEAVVHPSTRLVVWLLVLVAIQGLDDRPLLAALLVLPLFGGGIMRRCGRLAWGARWLFLSLFVILAWGGAGDPVWDGAMAPSREGLLDALTHVVRLLLVLMAVAVLREWMSFPDLLTAAHRLLEPLRHCGVDPERGLVRLMLVMRCIETTPRPRDWRILLDLPASGSSEVFEIADRQFSSRDYLTLVLATFAFAALFYFRQV